MSINFESYCQAHPSAFEQDHLLVNRDLSNLWEVLNDYGVAVVPNLLTTEECESSISHINSFYASLTKNMARPFDASDASTYATLKGLHNLHSMLYQSYGIGQCQGSWDIRQNPKVFEVFQRLWESDDLLCSMDGLSFQIAPEAEGSRGDASYFQNTWFHTDQSYTRNDLECIQGQVPLHDVAPGDATLVVLEGSHRFHKAFAERFGAGSVSDWCLLEQRGKEKGEGYLKFYADMGCTEKRITCPRGSLVLWDSRTIHCGSGPIRNRPCPDHWRRVVYVCMTPRYLCTDKNMDLRIKAFQELQTTSHWPHRLNIFRKCQGSTGPGNLINLEDQKCPELTEIGQRLLLGNEGASQFAEIVCRAPTVSGGVSLDGSSMSENRSQPGKKSKAVSQKKK